jgi:hypothetical protein
MRFAAVSLLFLAAAPALAAPTCTYVSRQHSAGLYADAMLSVSTTLSLLCARCRRWSSCTPRRALCSQSRTCARGSRTTPSPRAPVHASVRRTPAPLRRSPASSVTTVWSAPAPRPRPPVSEVSSVLWTPALRPWPSVSKVSPARRAPAFPDLRRLGAPVPMGCTVPISHCRSRRAHADS